MIDRKAFFDGVRPMFGGRLAQGAVDGLNAILDEWERRPPGDLRHLSYMLATAFHETGPVGAPGHMLPVTERGGPDYFKRYDGRADLGNIEPGDGYRFRGRGLVQLTGRANYRRAGMAVGRDLVKEPDSALEPAVAVRIMFEGMAAGWFTGKKLADFFHGIVSEWTSARRIINGLDRAELVAGYGKRFHGALEAATVAPAAS